MYRLVCRLISFVAILGFLKDTVTVCASRKKSSDMDGKRGSYRPERER